MENNHFRKWIPHKDVDTVYDMEDVGFHRGEGFVVLIVPDNLEHDKRSEYNVKLIWEDILCYKVTGETYRPDVWISNPDDSWTFYESQSSEFLENFKEGNILSPDEIYHFLIAGTNFIIDILSTEYPKTIFVK